MEREHRDWMDALQDGPVGFAGVPPPQILTELRQRGRILVDLDVPAPGLRLSESDPWLPRVTCAILRTILIQAMQREDLVGVVIASGADKCDGARYIGHILAELAPCPVLLTENLRTRRRPTPISDGGLPLREKVSRIMNRLLGVEPGDPGPAVAPPAAFWGVPPWDLSLLDLFPEGTRVLGWTRCVEAGVPADLELERHVLPEVPTVYFAQTFCAKNALARHLARKTAGLHVEVDGRASRSSRAKIDAFLRLSGMRRQD